MKAMDRVMNDNIIKACRILLGADNDINRDFLSYLQPSGITSAFRKKALATHPDRFIMHDEETRRRSTELFIEAKWAHEQLLAFCRRRDNTSPSSPARSKVIPADETSGRADSGQAGIRGQGKFYRRKFPDRKLLFAEFLFYAGAISWKAFIEAIVWQRRQRPRFGDIARHWGYLSDYEIALITSRKNFSEPMGETAVRLGMLSRFQVNTVLFRQRIIQRPIGEYFVEYRYLTQEAVHELLESFKRHNERFTRPTLS